MKLRPWRSRRSQPAIQLALPSSCGMAVAVTLMSMTQPGHTATVPEELQSTLFTGPDITPSPAVICAAPTGEVFVGVDKQGSLGKAANLGSIVRLIDSDNDGKADQHTLFATIDNPRGLIALGNQLIVLHCTQKDGKPYNQQISVYTDADGDGIADGPLKPLVTGIGNPKFVQSRGADHCTNNIRLGIDGWVYVSVGDFGFVGAKGTDGKTLTMHGGGVVRVRPDGTELETFIHGTRNVYDVAIDPFMNVFTRENTNDGVGWWIRFSHYVQSGEYGYPSLYTNFPEDMLPALGEYGGGSGTGNLFLQEPQWPAKYNNQALLADWGRSQIFIHKTEPNGASFTNEPIEFIGSSQVADLDIDASGRMYIAAWAGAGYRGNANKGYVDRVVPKDWKYTPFPKLSTLPEKPLIELIKSPSITIRTYASQELVRRNATSASKALASLAEKSNNILESRVAAIYTLAQLNGKDALPELKTLAAIPELCEHAIRCMADRLEVAKHADVNYLIKALADHNPRVQVAAAVALGRTGKQEAAASLVSVANLPSTVKAMSAKKPGDQSQVVFKKRKKVEINSDISSFKRLFLVVDSEGANKMDSAVWLNPTVITKDGKKIDLTQKKWIKATSSKGKVLINKDHSGKPLATGQIGIGTHAPSLIEFKLPENAAKFTATGILTKEAEKAGKVSFIVSPESIKLGPATKSHSTPNKEIILPHVARQALLALNAEEAVIAGLRSSDETKIGGALATMKWMHTDKVVDALITKATSSTGQFQQNVINTLLRLHQRENDYDGSTWWQTRPNPDGPYYYPVDWSGSDKIANFITSYLESAPSTSKAATIYEMKRTKAYIAPFNSRPSQTQKKVKTIAKTAIEDVILHLQKSKGNAKRGAKIINKVGCAACHNVTPDAIVKGPDLTKLGNVIKDDIAAAIIKPAATIATSWVTITMNDGTAHTGTIVQSNKKEIILHNIAGMPTQLDATQVKATAPGLNMMSLHLCDSLTLEEFTDLVEYIQSMDPSRKKK